MQRITTREPDDAQIECAIASLKASMPNEFPPEEKTELSEESLEIFPSETESNEEK